MQLISMFCAPITVKNIRQEDCFAPCSYNPNKN